MTIAPWFSELKYGGKFEACKTHFNNTYAAFLVISKGQNFLFFVLITEILVCRWVGNSIINYEKPSIQVYKCF